MANDSSTGGYLVPAPSTPIPGGLSFRQFLSTVFSGIAGLDPTLCRPRWQANPPKQPDIQVNWMAMGITNVISDMFSYVGMQPDGSFLSVRNENMEIACSFYGPDALEYAGIVKDGFQISQNLDNLRAVKMNFKETGTITHLPDLVHERWVNRYDMSVFLSRQIQRTYPILDFVSAQVTLISRTSGADYSNTIIIEEMT